MNLHIDSLIGYTWDALMIVWLIGLAYTKRTVRAQAPGPRLFHMALVLFGFTLIGSGWLSQGWLGYRFLPAVEPVEIVGLALTVAGCLFAIWARIKLGGNWSGRATVKRGHELVTTGPYALARHPIYTGLAAAALGTGFAIGEMRCLVGLLLVMLAFMVKMSQEERLMMETFPQAYPAYRQRVRALIPGVL
ncbi:MAG: isoprenylcysteine carboxylmethyltransferase family protein [Terracidiphilus sp.]|jgi:protein-S-isoprenylcysteine O-methyltransferase Ste14